jgi:hypothetical protein
VDNGDACLNPGDRKIIKDCHKTPLLSDLSQNKKISSTWRRLAESLLAGWTCCLPSLLADRPNREMLEVFDLLVTSQHGLMTSKFLHNKDSVHHSAKHSGQHALHANVFKTFLQCVASNQHLVTMPKLCLWCCCPCEHCTAVCQSGATTHEANRF